MALLTQVSHALCVVARRRSAALPSPLMPYLLNDLLPHGFLLDLVAAVAPDPDSTRGVFEPVLQGLATLVKTLALDTDEFKAPLDALRALTDVKVGGTRPVCNLVGATPRRAVGPLLFVY